MSHPLVVGKSGSLLVNVSGSDVNFSMDVKDGPARRFLAENALCWNKTEIAVHPCNDEGEAYQLECNIAKSILLFNS